MSAGVKALFGLCAALVLLASSTAASGAENLKPITQAEYLDDLTRLEASVAACQARPQACDSAGVTPDARVAGGNGESSFTIRFDWLRTALEAAKDPHTENRAEILGESQARLVAERAELLGAPAALTEPEPADARAKADAVLRGREFGRVRQESYLEQKLALVRLWLDHFLLGAAMLVPHSPWVGLALEWGAVGLAAAGLIVWAFRVSRQQRVAIASAGTQNAGWQKESDDWAERARVSAGSGDWREAVHCLYWAAIVMLEGERLWRANRARTPREYVQLLEPGSARRRALRSLTGVFERIWYGLRPAGEQDYRQAETLLADLKAGAS